jgi:predicted PurR-regulated permease PerM
MGRGSEIPAAVILVGAIGGMLLHGMIGLFVGAVVFSTGYSLLREWVLRESQSGPVDGGGTANAAG